MSLGHAMLRRTLGLWRPVRLGLPILCIWFWTACIGIGGGTDDPNTMDPGAVVTGVVTGPGALPIQGAEVRLLLAKPGLSGIEFEERTVRSDIAGRFTFGDLPPGKYIAHGQSGALALMLSGVEASLAAPAELDMALKEKVALSGRVLAAKAGQAGIAGVLVYPPGSDTMAVTDSSGVYRLENMPQGSYPLYFARENASGFLPLRFAEKAAGEIFVRDVPAPVASKDTAAEPVVEMKTKVYAPGAEPEWYQGKDFSGLL